jgi:hypothetical protein
MNIKLKNRIFAILCILFVSGLLKAQDDRDFRVGFKLIPGVNWVKSKTSFSQGNGSGVGYSFGFMLDIKIADNYYFTPEINITSMTNRVKLKDTNIQVLNNNLGHNFNNISYKYNLQYFEIPLTFKFRTNESNGLRFWGQFGVAPGFIIGNNLTTSATAINPATGFPTDEKYNPNTSESDVYDFLGYEDNINVFRASMILGAGIEYRISGNNSLYLGARFNNGFTDLLNDKRGKVINNVLGLEVGMFF